MLFFYLSYIIANTSLFLSTLFSHLSVIPRLLPFLLLFNNFTIFTWKVPPSFIRKFRIYFAICNRLVPVLNPMSIQIDHIFVQKHSSHDHFISFLGPLYPNVFLSRLQGQKQMNILKALKFELLLRSFTVMNNRTTPNKMRKASLKDFKRRRVIDETLINVVMKSIYMSCEVWLIAVIFC